MLWPFGRRSCSKPTAGVASAIGNIIWIVVAGIWLAIAHIVSAIVLFITIIGIPLAIAELKIIPMTLTPLGRQIVPSDEAFATYGSVTRV